LGITRLKLGKIVRRKGVQECTKKKWAMMIAHKLELSSAIFQYRRFDLEVVLTFCSVCEEDVVTSCYVCVHIELVFPHKLDSLGNLDS